MATEPNSKVSEDIMSKLSKHLGFVAAFLCAVVCSSLHADSALAQAKPLKDMPVFGTTGTSTFTGTLSITKLTFGDQGLVANGKVTGFLARQRISQTFSNVPVALFAEGASDPIDLASRTPLQLDPNEPFVCDILFLDLAPLHLNLLGLELDLSEVVLDLDAVSGPGNLVGNLLCAVTGLLDVVDLGVILEGILQAILDALNGLL
jgi:hypothetical protein